MSELEDGKAKFLEIVKSLDSSVTVVIPTAATNALFLISLAKGIHKKFITVSEDDLMDLASDPDILDDVKDLVTEALSKIPS